MKHALLLLISVCELQYGISQPCTASITPSGATTFCAGDSVVLSADTAGNTWTQKANFGGTAREGPTGFSIGTKGYIGMGWDGNFRKDFWQYNPSTNTWAAKTSFGGTGRYYGIGFSIGTKGYMGMGSGGPDF